LPSVRIPRLSVGGSERASSTAARRAVGITSSGSLPVRFAPSSTREEASRCSPRPLGAELLPRSPLRPRTGTTDRAAFQLRAQRPAQELGYRDVECTRNGAQGAQRRVELTVLDLLPVLEIDAGRIGRSLLGPSARRPEGCDIRGEPTLNRQELVGGIHRYCGSLPPFL
jgi:hypothetical protein